MKNHILRALSAIVFVSALSATPSFAQQSYKELPNFQKVSDRLYRGGQPAKGGLKKLVELGVTTIVNLRGEDDNTRAEQKEAAALGLRYYALPMGGLSRPSDAEIERALEIINDTENGTVFIHCKHGSDRTGTVIACYRMSQEGYTVEQAQREAKRYGMHWVQFRMRGYIGDYYKKRGLSKREAIKQKAVGEVEGDTLNLFLPLMN